MEESIKEGGERSFKGEKRRRLGKWEMFCFGGSKIGLYALLPTISLILSFKAVLIESLSLSL